MTRHISTQEKHLRSAIAVLLLVLLFAGGLVTWETTELTSAHYTAGFNNVVEARMLDDRPPLFIQRP